MTNHVAVVGTVATDPKMIARNTESRFCSFRLASNDRRYDRGKSEWIDGPTNWFTINAFRALGDHALDSFRKGDRVVLTGRLRVRSWERDDKSGTSVDIEVDAIGHDLRWGTSQFTKTAGQVPDSHRGDETAVQRWPDTPASSEEQSGPSSDGPMVTPQPDYPQGGAFTDPEPGAPGFAGTESFATV